MALPVNINQLISGKTVEWDRLEFKKGWNPEELDDRINYHADLSDLSPLLVKAFLNDVKSDLALEADNIPFVDLCRQMQIVGGSSEMTKPKNVGLLFFSNHPEKFFPYTRIEIIHFLDDIGDRFVEQIFSGSLLEQLKSALLYFKNQIIREMVLKVPEQAESIRFFNYPYEAIEEALVNAVYHKSYI